VNPHILILLLGGLTCLIGLTATGFWLVSEQQRDKLWAERRETTIGAYLKPKASAGPTLMLAPRQTRKQASAMAQVYAVLNWREERRQHYPMSWWGVMLVMMGPALIGSLLASRLLGSAGWFALPILDLLMTRTFLGYCSNKISKLLLAQFPDALSMVARSVRVGVPIGEAVKVVSREGLTPTREEFGKAADAVAIGLDMESALMEMAERNDLAEYRFFATALALQSQTGGGLTETLDTLADTIRKREAARKRGNALASEAKTSIYVLAALPVVVGFMLWLTNPDYIDVLFITDPGNKLLAAAVFMLSFGMFAMQQIIKRSLS
jgi:tight adherence protein B